MNAHEYLLEQVLTALNHTRFGRGARLHRLAVFAVLCMLVAGCAPGTPAPPAAPPQALTPPVPQAHASECMAHGAFPPLLPGLRYGINAFLFGTNQERVLTLTKNAGFGWLRQQIHWHDMEVQPGVYNWGALDLALAHAQQQGVRLLVSVVRSPPWATADGNGGLPDDPAALGRFMHALAARYQGRIPAYEIWNEPNLAVENGGRVPTPAQYLHVLESAYANIKAADPCALVLAAPLSATATNDPAIAMDDLAFYRALYTLDGGAFLRSADLLGLHPGGGPHPFDALWSDTTPDQSRTYFRHVEQIQALMKQYGDQRQAWITEVGWATQPAPGAPQPVSPEQQAENLVGALQLTRSNYPWITGIFVWNLNFPVLGAADDEKSSFGILNADWSPKPAYMALQSYLHQLASASEQAAPQFSQGAPYQQDWQFRASGKVRTPAVIGPDGTLYMVSDPGHMYAVSPAGALRWAFDPPGETRDAPALGANGTIMVGDIGGHLTALDDHGRVRWQQRVGDTVRGTPIMAADRVYISTNNAVLQLSMSGDVLWRTPIASAAGAALSADATRLYVTTIKGEVQALSAANGATLWSTKIEHAIYSAPAVAPDQLLVGDAEGMLTSLDTATGHVRWQHTFVQRVVSPTLLDTSPLIGAPPLVAHDGMIYLSGRDGTLSAIRADGSLRWRYASGGDISATALQGPDGVLYVTSMDERLLAIGADGQLRWQASVNGGARSTPAVERNGMLYVTTLSGILYALVPR
jgi:outer membrane protein assembly factor BamB